MKDKVQNPDVTNTYMQRAVTCSRTVFVFAHNGSLGEITPSYGRKKWSQNETSTSNFHTNK